METRKRVISSHYITFALFTINYYHDVNSKHPNYITRAEWERGINVMRSTNVGKIK